MNSPVTGKPMTLIKKVESLEYKSVSIDVIQKSYYCNDSDTDWTNDKLDEWNIKAVKYGYWLRNKLGSSKYINAIINIVL